MLPGIDYLVAGLVVLGVVWLPLILNQTPLTLPIFAVGAGWLLFGLTGRSDMISDNIPTIEILTEIVLIVSVMGAALKIDRNLTLAGWGSTWRLLGIVMPGVIFGIALLAVWLLEVPLGVGILIGAVLAPTDPVLASTVGLGPPGRGEEGEVRFSLTSEAGLNDGLAFPFVVLGTAMLAGQTGDGSAFLHWALVEVLWKVLAGVVIGGAIGYFLVQLNAKIPSRFRLSTSGEGLAIIGVMFLVYGCAEFASANGFVAVFSSGVAIRSISHKLDYTKETYAFAQQIERLLMVIILLLFGGVLAGGILPSASPNRIVFVILALFAVRPLFVAIGFLRSGVAYRDRTAIGYFGIRGLGAIYYGFYAMSHGAPDVRNLWPEISFAVLLSVVVYGVTAHWVMKVLGQYQGTGEKKSLADQSERDEELAAGQAGQ
jgi:NhaP-type Na+/H+ or K+/H+ antiporter